MKRKKSFILGLISNLFQYIKENISIIIYLLIGVFLITAIIYYIDLNTVFSSVSTLYTVYLFFPLIGINAYLLVKSVNDKKKELKKQDEENTQLKQYIELIENYQTKLSKYKHDINNFLIAIKGFVDTKDYTAFESYFNQHLFNEYKKYRDQDAFLNELFHIKNPDLKGIISFKLNHAIDLGVDVTFNVFEDIDFKQNSFDICRILGIFLDNAVEESSLSPVKRLTLLIAKFDDSISLIVSNSFTEKPNLTRISEKGFSTKGTSRGLGLFIVQDIIAENKHLNVKTSMESDMLVQELIASC
ncbi:MAG: GHKL domain-containing protein [Ruminiclostridium sp.]|nr:GHKL domain-containing protein [Ruminiclostridium sp.]